ncbi:MAG TPA: transcription termination/antitermination protein NusG [Thermoanaerobaculia bacterium]|nr:transcription termination/antitermination protein NusG [Thermoanaerobaculia bacterium]
MNDSKHDAAAVDVATTEVPAPPTVEAGETPVSAGSPEPAPAPAAASSAGSAAAAAETPEAHDAAATPEDHPAAEAPGDREPAVASRLAPRPETSRTSALWPPAAARVAEPPLPPTMVGMAERSEVGGERDERGARGEARAQGPRDRKWYIVHTYSGFEERVKETLRQRGEALDMGDAFGEIRIPTETVVEYKGGKKRETQRKFFPGYILVEMEMSDAAWHVVKNTPKVTGFVGTGRKPTPLSQEEVDQILEQVVTAKEKPKPKYVFEKAEPVRITDGPFNNFTGVVDDVNLDRNTLKVMVTIFGRQTPVELDFSQVQKI